MIKSTITEYQYSLLSEKDKRAVDSIRMHREMYEVKDGGFKPSGVKGKPEPHTADQWTVETLCDHAGKAGVKANQIEYGDPCRPLKSGSLKHFTDINPALELLIKELDLIKA